MPTARVLFLAATLGGISFTIYAVITDPPPLWLSLVCVHAYLALMLAGVFVIRLRMFTDAIIRGPKGAKGVVLTFDDGPDPKHAREVLDILDAHDAKATFFLIGKKVEQHPDVAAEIVRRGHEVGVHGFAARSPFASRPKARQGRSRARGAGAREGDEAASAPLPSADRAYESHDRAVADALDLTVVGWSIAGYDGIARAKPDRVAARVKAQIDDGEIVLLHDAAEKGDHDPAGPKALAEILASAKDKNLRIAKLGDWLEDWSFAGGGA